MKTKTAKLFKTRPRMKKRLRGITLLELAIVVAIIGSLIAIFAANLGDSKASLDAKTAKLKFQQDKLKIQMWLDEYRGIHGQYPDESQGLEVLHEQVPGSPDNWSQIVKKKKMLFDPYNRVYSYRLENGQPKIISLGADGAEGGSGDNADVDLDQF